MKLEPGTRRSRSRWLVAVAAVLMLAAWVTLAPPNGLAQGRGARQAGPPNPLGQPLIDGRGHVRDDAMIHAPLPAAEAQYGDIDGRRMKAVVDERAAISTKNRADGEVFWGRNV